MSLVDKIRGAEPADQFPDEFPDELKTELDPDPVPSKAARRPARTTRVVSALAKKKLADEIEAMLLLTSGAWQMRDEYCGSVLEKQARKIATSLAAIMGKNPALVEWMHTSGVIGDWMTLAMAIWPVVQAIRVHHISRTVNDEEEGSAADFDPGAFPAYRPGS